MKLNVCVPPLNILQKMYSKTTAYVSELILTLFSPFDIKYKNLVQKTCGNKFLGHLGW